MTRSWVFGLTITLGCVSALTGCEVLLGNNNDYMLESVAQGGGGASSSSSTNTGSSGDSVSSSGSGGGGCMPAEPTCGVEQIASDNVTVFYGNITLSDSFVFWVDNGALGQHSKEPSQMPPTVILPTHGILHLAAINDMEFFLGAAGSVEHFKLLDSSPTLILGNTSPSGVAVFESFAYWPSQVDHMLHKGVDGSTMTVANSLAMNPSFIASYNGPDDVFWTYLGEPIGIGGVRRIGLNPDFEPDQDRPTGIAVDADAVYWITADGIIHRKKKIGGPATASKKAFPAGAAFKPKQIVVSGSHVYWLGVSTSDCAKPNCTCASECSAVWTAPTANLGGGEEVIFAQGDWVTLDGLAADATHVYWTATTSTSSVLLRKKTLP